MTLTRSADFSRFIKEFMTCLRRMPPLPSGRYISEIALARHVIAGRSIDYLVFA